MTSDVDMAHHDVRWAQDAVRDAERKHATHMEALNGRLAIAREQLQRAETRERIYEAECPASERVDGPKHSWRWDGDDPRTVCVYCGEVRDALNGSIIVAGRKPQDAGNSNGAGS